MLEALDKHKAERHAINGMNPFGPNNSFGKHRNEVRRRSHSYKHMHTQQAAGLLGVIPQMTSWGESKICIAEETVVSLSVLLLSLLPLDFIVVFYSCVVECCLYCHLST